MYKRLYEDYSVIINFDWNLFVYYKFIFCYLEKQLHVQTWGKLKIYKSRKIYVTDDRLFMDCIVIEEPVNMSLTVIKVIWRYFVIF